MLVPGLGKCTEDAVNLFLAASFERHIDQRVTQAHTVICAIELKFDDIRMMRSDQARQLMQGSRPV